MFGVGGDDGFGGDDFDMFFVRSVVMHVWGYYWFDVMCDVILFDTI